MIGALVGAAVAGVGTTTALSARRWRRAISDESLRRVRASRTTSSDLAAVGTDADVWVPQVLRSVLAGAGIGLVLGLLAAVVVGPLGLVFTPAAGALGWALARRRLRTGAEAARVDLRMAALEMAELASLAIGAGLGVSAALERAATALSGEAGARLGLLAHSGPEPWVAIEALGADAGVDELCDLGRTLAIGVRHQARTREVLLAWASTLRSSRLEESEAAAAATTEAMTGPLALVAFGFLLAVGVPAVLQLLGAAGGVRL